MNAPRGLGTGGKRLWNAVTDAFDLEQHELDLLQATCRVRDILDRITSEIADAPMTTTNRHGETVTHPLFVEYRMQSAAFAKLLASLRMPAGESGERPQVRGGSRQPYGVRGVV